MTNTQVAPDWGIFKVQIHYEEMGIAEVVVAATNDVGARRSAVGFERHALDKAIAEDSREAEAKARAAAVFGNEAKIEPPPETNTAIAFCEVELLTWIDHVVSSHALEGVKTSIPPGAGLHVFIITISYWELPEGRSGIVIAAEDDEAARVAAIELDRLDRFGDAEKAPSVQYCGVEHVATIDYSGEV